MLGKKALGLKHILETTDFWPVSTQTHLQLFILSLQVFQDDLQLLLVLALTLALRGVLLGLTPAVLLATAKRQRELCCGLVTSSLRSPMLRIYLRCFKT